MTPTKGGPFDQLPGNTPVFGQVNFSVPSDIGGGSPQNSHSTVARFDYNLSDRTTIYGRYALESANFFAGTVSFSPYQGFNTGQEAFNNNGLVSVTHVFAPNLVSQTKAVFNRLNLRQPLGKATVGPTLFFQQNTVTSILGTNAALPGYLPFSPGNAIPFGGPQNLAQFYQDVNYTRGKHQLRFGGQYIYTQDNRTFGAFETAAENLSSGNLATSFDNFLNGQLFSFQGAVDPQGKFPCVTDASGQPIVTPACTITLPVQPPQFSRSNLYNDAAAYAQDSWKIRPRLTVNLGET